MDLYICMLKVITDKFLTPMKFSMENIINLFAQKGSQMYGHEAVTQLEHGLQCATLASESGLSYDMIAACLLHELGH
mgnify:CR=1 FL=1